MEGRILFLLCAIVASASAAMLLVGYGELRGARECSAVIIGSGAP